MRGNGEEPGRGSRNPLDSALARAYSVRLCMPATAAPLGVTMEPYHPSDGGDRRSNPLVPDAWDTAPTVHPGS